MLGAAATPLPAKYILSATGEQILSEWKSKWNKKDGKTVWNYEDCWPIYLFNDVHLLRDRLENHFNVLHSEIFSLKIKDLS